MKINVEQVMTAVESGEYLGICIACGFEQEGVEPDARKYTCEECGKPAVYGAEELMLEMGMFDPNYIEELI